MGSACTSNRQLSFHSSGQMIFVTFCGHYLHWFRHTKHGHFKFLDKSAVESVKSIHYTMRLSCANVQLNGRGSGVRLQKNYQYTQNSPLSELYVEQCESFITELAQMGTENRRIHLILLFIFKANLALLHFYGNKKLQARVCYCCLLLLRSQQFACLTFLHIYIFCFPFMHVRS